MLDIEKFKVTKKSEFEIEQNKITNDIFEQLGFMKFYILGQISMIKSLIEVINTRRDYEHIDKDDLIVILKGMNNESNSWANDIINKTLNKNV